jgi:hypothetical protein
LSFEVISSTSFKHLSAILKFSLHYYINFINSIILPLLHFLSLSLSLSLSLAPLLSYSLTFCSLILLLSCSLAPSIFLISLSIRELHSVNLILSHSHSITFTFYSHSHSHYYNIFISHILCLLLLSYYLLPHSLTLLFPCPLNLSLFQSITLF